MGDMISIPLITNIQSHTSDSDPSNVRPQEAVVETEQTEYVHAHTHRYFVRTFIGLRTYVSLRTQISLILTANTKCFC